MKRLDKVKEMKLWRQKFWTSKKVQYRVKRERWMQQNKEKKIRMH